jgi:hypothetical protein
MAVVRSLATLMRGNETIKSLTFSCCDEKAVGSSPTVMSDLVSVVCDNPRSALVALELEMWSSRLSPSSCAALVRLIALPRLRRLSAPLDEVAAIVRTTQRSQTPSCPLW